MEQKILLGCMFILLLVPFVLGDAHILGYTHVEALNSSDNLTLSTGAIVTGIQTTITDTDTQIATSGAIVDYFSTVADSNETTNVSWMVDYITNQTADDCPSGNYSYGVSTNGSMLCRDDTGGSITDSNETTNVSWMVDYITNQTTDDCASGSFATGLYANGSVVCTTDVDSNLTGADVVTMVGNWSDDKSSYLPLTGGVITGPLTIIGAYFNATVTNQYLNGSAIPELNNTFDLGSLAYFWNNIYSNYYIGDGSKLYNVNYTKLTGTEVVTMVGNYSAWDKDYDDLINKPSMTDSNETTNVSWIVDYITNQTADDCPSGNYSYGTSANGSVLCRDDIDTDTTIGNETTNVTWIVDYITNQTTDNCPSGNYSYGTSVNGSHLCREDTDTDTQLSGTDVIAMVGNYSTHVELDTNLTGTDVIVMVGNYSADEVSIANWNKTYADTLYSDSNETTNVTWIVDYITNQTADDCASGSFATGLSDNGSVVCTADVDSNLTEDNVEAYIFDSDNTAALDMNGYPIYGVIELNVTGNIELTGGLMLGNTTDAIAGTLRWTGTALEVYDGDTWKIIASATAGVECPTGFILVPGNAVLGTTTDFCVMKYEAKNVSGVATSQADGAPWVSINQTDAIAECSDIGAHLCTVNEVQTINRNIEAQGANWNSTVVGTGSLWKGHEDNSPANALVASSNDSDYYSGTGDSGTSLQRRTHTLSNGNVIWDWSGNVWEWMYGEGAGGTIGSDPAWYSTGGWIEWNNTQLDSPERGKLGPSYSGWTADNGIGRYYGGVGTNAFRRGGSWSLGADAGVFALDLHNAPSGSYAGIGLRCCVS